MLYNFVSDGLKFVLTRCFGFIPFAAIDIFGMASITLPTTKKTLLCLCLLAVIKKWDVKVQTSGYDIND